VKTCAVGEKRHQILLFLWAQVESVAKVVLTVKGLKYIFVKMLAGSLIVVPSPYAVFVRMSVNAEPLYTGPRISITSAVETFVMGKNTVRRMNETRN